jgi:hypothetical protein
MGLFPMVLIFLLTKEISLDINVDSGYAGLWQLEDNQDPVCVKSCTRFVTSCADFPQQWQSK